MHPELRASDDDKEVVERRPAQEHHAEEVLSDLDRKGPHAPDLDAFLQQLRDEVLGPPAAIMDRTRDAIRAARARLTLTTPLR